MALDTYAKRWSFLNFDWFDPPIPDGTLDAPDRSTFLGMYRQPDGPPPTPGARLFRNYDGPNYGSTFILLG